MDSCAPVRLLSPRRRAAITISAIAVCLLGLLMAFRVVEVLLLGRSSWWTMALTGALLMACASALAHVLVSSVSLTRHGVVIAGFVRKTIPWQLVAGVSVIGRPGHRRALLRLNDGRSVRLPLPRDPWFDAAFHQVGRWWSACHAIPSSQRRRTRPTVAGALSATGAFAMAVAVVLPMTQVSAGGPLAQHPSRPALWKTAVPGLTMIQVLVLRPLGLACRRQCQLTLSRSY